MILYPSYFSDIITLSHLYDQDVIEIERHGNFVKQTYRNRCYIAGANGKQSLNVPMIHTGKGRSVPFTDIEIDFTEPWSINHLRSIKSAYNSSPFYQYYEDDLVALFDEIPTWLFDWNMKTLEFLKDHLGLNFQSTSTENFKNDPLANRLITAKGKPIVELDPYIQVFQERHGFIQPLSGLDLLFNLGPSAIAYLKEQQGKPTTFG